jgi:citrate synthase
MSRLEWRTGLSQVQPGSIHVRGYDIADLIDRASFGDMTYLLLKGEWPARREGALIEAILVSSVDHSLAAPSTDATRLVASSGVPLPAAVAAGLLAVGEHHGGAIERCAQLMQEAWGKPTRAHDDDDQAHAAKAAGLLVAGLRARRERMPGYGHPVHPIDPRVAPLFARAAELGLSGRWVTLAQAIEWALFDATGRPLPINVDGAIAALLLEMGLDWRAGKAFFLISRALGLSAHYLEQVTREKPFKAADYTEVVYDGPPPRELPDA